MSSARRRDFRRSMRFFCQRIPSMATLIHAIEPGQHGSQPFLDFQFLGSVVA